MADAVAEPAAEPRWRAVAEARVAELLRDPGAEIVTSRLSRLECRVAPLRAGDAGGLAWYDEFFSRRRVTVAEVDAAVPNLSPQPSAC